MSATEKDHTMFQMKLPPELHSKFRAVARAQDLPMSFIARRLFEREIERHESAVLKKKQRRA